MAGHMSFQRKQSPLEMLKAWGEQLVGRFSVMMTCSACAGHMERQQHYVPFCNARCCRLNVTSCMAPGPQPCCFPPATPWLAHNRHVRHAMPCYVKPNHLVGACFSGGQVHHGISQQIGINHIHQPIPGCCRAGEPARSDWGVHQL